MKALLVVATLLVVESTSAQCTMPVPDGDGPEPSTANLHGRISGVEPRGKVVVTEASSKRSVTVVLPSTNPDIYSAFGGDVQPEQLKVGQTVWIWFLNCKRPSAGLPIAAYFRVYSTDPNEHP